MNLFFTLLFTVELGFNAFSHWYAPVVKLWFDQSSVQPSSSASTPSPTGTPRVNTVVPWSNPVVKGLVKVGDLVKLWCKDWSKFGTAGLPRLVPLARSGQNPIELLVKVPAKNSRRIATNRKSWLDNAGCTKIKR